MQLNKNRIITKIITLATETDDVDVLWMYGSQTRNNADINSDYDLAILFKAYLDDPIERRLRPELLSLTWNQMLTSEISIIDINQSPLPLAYTVIQDNTVLYSNNDFRRMSEEQKIMSKWEIDHCYHRKHYA